MNNKIYKLTNNNGVEIEFIAYGGKLKSILVPSTGNKVDILMGYDTVDLKTEIIYALNNNNEFIVDIQAKTDKPTIVNINIHPYFNLNGVGQGKIFNHELEINSSYFTPFREQLIPTGEIKQLKNTNIDFSKKRRVGDCISANCSLIRPIGGIDHNFIIDKKKGELAFACKLTEPESGRGVEVYTTNHALQVYTAMNFNGSEIGKGSLPLQQYNGISLQAQNFPDSINNKNFPNCVLNPDEVYSEKIIYKLII